MSREELLRPAADPVEAAEETTLRPRRLDEFVGQPRLTEHLEILLDAAKQRGQAVDHLLFAGPPGTGKTSLAGIVAAEMEASLRITSGPALERAGDLAAILTNLDDGDVLFVDEIHRLPRAVEEVLYPAMEDFQLDIVIGRGPVGALDPARPAAVHPRRRHHPRRADHRTAARPLRVRRPARVLRARRPRHDRRARGPHPRRHDRRGRRAAELAGRAAGTPRIANRLLKRVRDYAEVRADGVIDGAVARAALDVFEVDERGLDRTDRAVLAALCVTFAGQAVGLGTLAVAVGEEPDTVEEVYEPFLLKQGLLLRTPRGRVATPAAYAHLDVPPPPGSRPCSSRSGSAPIERSASGGEPRRSVRRCRSGGAPEMATGSANLPDPACLSSSSTSRCSQSPSSS